MKNVLLFDQFGAGSTYSGPGNYFVNLLSANSSLLDEFRFSLMHGNTEQLKMDVFEDQYMPAGSGGIFRDLFFSYQAKKILNDITYDIFQSTHCYMSSINAAHHSIKLDKPCFLRVAKSNSELKNRSLISNVFDFSKNKINVINNSCGVVAISSEIEKELLNVGVDERKIYKIFNGVNVKRFNNKKSELSHPFFDGSLVIAFCGALIERKRPNIILDVLKELPDKYKACFIGPFDKSDAYVQQFLNKIKLEKLESRVLLTGFIDNPEEYLKSSSFFCLLSQNEGMPNALLEAMSCGLYPISTPISGVTDIITKPEFGLMTLRLEPHIIASEILNISELNISLLSSNISNHIKSEFSAEKIFSKYKDMYGEHI